jgi:hypothetical protein
MSARCASTRDPDIREFLIAPRIPEPGARNRAEEHNQT